MRSIDRWLEEYGDSHRNPVNKRVHWICVPVIVWCVLALLWSVPTTGDFHSLLNWAVLAVAAALVYYSWLSMRLAAGAAVLLIAMLYSIDRTEHFSAEPLWLIGAVLFVIAWIGQFIGHHVEGKRPSFFKDVQFLMIGPLWLLADLYRRLGIRY
ncbi:MAG: Mpo1-like protein [Steroidobacteraceae bacterium]|jgi:uncharacterized membrane protein YGL010W